MCYKQHKMLLKETKYAQSKTNFLFVEIKAFTVFNILVILPSLFYYFLTFEIFVVNELFKI